MSCASSKYHLLERYLGVLYLIKAETRTTRTTRTTPPYCSAIISSFTHHRQSGNAYIELAQYIIVPIIVIIIPVRMLPNITTQIFSL